MKFITIQNQQINLANIVRYYSYEMGDSHFIVFYDVGGQTFHFSFTTKEECQRILEYIKEYRTM